ncbi:MAG: heparinase II/III family protein [Mucinivorans sp.]
MKKKLTTLLLVLTVMCSALGAWGYEKKDMLTRAASLDEVKAALVVDQAWVPYPAYTDRQGWDKLTGDYKNDLISAGERSLNYVWQVVPATSYLEFERSGNRRVMERPLGENIGAITNLFLAEMAEGKGRFMDQLINGVFSICEMTSWGASAHLVVMPHRRALPSYKENILELGQGDLSSLLSWVYFYLKPSMDKVDPIIAERLRAELERRMLTPYLENTYWWQAFDAKPTTMVNNWNVWCNFNALQCFMLLENDRDRLARAVYRTMTSVDKFIDYSKSDGACEEGPSYWGHAAGKMYDYLQSLYMITGGKVSVFDRPQIRAMGEYIVNAYVGDGWVVNFADASAQAGGEAGVIYRFGRAVGSRKMINYAATQSKEKLGSTRDIFRTLQTMLTAEDFAKLASQPLINSTVWYPQTQVAFINEPQSGFFVATKAGHNNESHNHNDIGTLSVYLNHTPILIDAGVGTYTRQTFSSERYDIWSMQSEYHSLPMINGVGQKFGLQYKANDVTFDERKLTFSSNIAAAYPSQAGVKSYVRTVSATSAKGGAVVVEDRFALADAVAPIVEHFMTWGSISIATPGVVKIDVRGQKAALHYDARLFVPSIDTVKLPDSRLSSVWGPEIYRLALTAKSTPLSGKYTFIIKKQ